MKLRFALHLLSILQKEIHVQREAGEILEDGSTLGGDIKGVLLRLFPVQPLGVARHGFLCLRSLVLGVMASPMRYTEEVELE